MYIPLDQHKSDGIEFWDVLLGYGETKLCNTFVKLHEMLFKLLSVSSIIVFDQHSKILTVTDNTYNKSTSNLVIDIALHKDFDTDFSLLKQHIYNTSILHNYCVNYAA